MGPAANVGARFRQRKISVKQTLQILKQSDIPDFDIEDQQRELQHIETGVEKGEEEEHHLQQVINASAAKFKGAKVEQVYIPTPDASKVWNEASKYYWKKFTEPEPYIKFSATVEDTSGCPYNMDERDEEFLTEMNKKFDEKDHCNEDEFEMVANRFDYVVSEKQPFLHTDPERILSFEEIKAYTFSESDVNLSNPNINPNLHLSEILAKKLKVESFKTLYDSDSKNNVRDLKTLFALFGELIYQHWKTRKIERGGKQVFPTLRFEENSEKDDNNPYTTFRRREFRQARKTRRTDVQSIEKLKLLYKDIKRAENLLTSISEREYKKMDLIETRLNIFKYRNELKQINRTDNTKHFEELFIDKPKKKFKILGYVPPPPPSPDKQIRKEKDSKKKVKGDASSSKKTSKQQQQEQEQAKQEELLQQQVIQQQKQQQQQKAVVTAQPYVKLPPSKIPDLDLQTVNGVLRDKLEGIKKAVSEKLIKRKLADEGWINFTDDPYNPYFDISNSHEKDIEQRTHIPCSSIVTSTFEVENSRELNFSHVFNNNRHYNNNDPEIIKINSHTGQLMKNDRLNHLPEFYDIIGDPVVNNMFGLTTQEIDREFSKRNELNVSEVKFKVRKRIGRNGMIWIDRKRIYDDDVYDDFINFDSDEEDLFEDSNERMDIDSRDEDDIVNKEDNEIQEKTRKRRNAYDCSNDYKKRLKSNFQFDSDLPIMSPLDPSKLNQIGKQTQVIRFGSMLTSKSYDNMHQIRQKQILQHQQKLQQRQQLQDIMKQKELSQGKASLLSNRTNSSSSKDKKEEKEKKSKSSSQKEKKSKKDGSLSSGNNKSKYGKKYTPKTSNKNVSDLSSSPKIKIKHESNASINGNGLSSNGRSSSHTIDKVEKENKVV